jgi:hypothetical protein
MFAFTLATALLAVPASATAPTPESQPSLCIATTVRHDGRASGSRVAVSSGDESVDKGALDFLKHVDFGRLGTKPALKGTGFVVVTQVGAQAYRLDLVDGALSANCPK